MRIAVICNTDSLAIPVLSMLNTRGLLLEVIMLEQYAAFAEALGSIGIQRERVTLLARDGWKASLTQWLERLKPDMTWVFAFPWKIPGSILGIPQKGFFNFHFGALPKYRGADPVFWQMKNREEQSELTIHRMSEGIDEGPVMMIHPMPMMQGENYGLLCSRLGAMAVVAAELFIEKEEAGKIVPAEQAEGESLHYRKPDEQHLRINWKEHSAEEIETLVNASNPRYGGAFTSLRGSAVRLLEVAPADMKDVPATEPGTIVYADVVYGLIVACTGNKFLRVNIVQMNEGYFSGMKLFTMGVRPGERFE